MDKTLKRYISHSKIHNLGDSKHEIILIERSNRYLIKLLCNNVLIGMTSFIDSYEKALDKVESFIENDSELNIQYEEAKNNE